MKLQIDRDVLFRGVARTQGVIARRSTMKILENFLLEARDGQVKISATDLEVSFCGFYPAQIQEEGALTVPAVSFFNILRELPSVSLELQETENASLKIQVGEARYQLLGLPADQFPPLPTAENLELIDFESRLFKEMIDKTIFSISTDELQHHLAGVYVEKIAENDIIKLRLVSTDGHRLSLIDRTIPGTEQFGFEGGILIPRKGIAEMQRLMGEEKHCSLGIDPKNLTLQQDNQFIFIRLLEKKFPNYRNIIPTEFPLQIVISRRELFEALKRLSLLSTERFKGVILNFSSESLELRYINPEVGEGLERLPISVSSASRADRSETVTSESAWEFPLEIGFNASYLMEPLGVMQDEKVYLQIKDKDKPCRLYGANDPDYFCIIMPMSL